MEYYDPRTHTLIADSERDPFASGAPAFEEVQKSAESLILSASGWRKVFATDGDEESTSKTVSLPDLIIVGTAALVLTEYLQSRTGNGRIHICTACDARPTGPAIMDVMHRVFLSCGAEVTPLFTAAAPEAMAAVKLNEQIDGFAYVSASHNPLGHNGLKFGGADGAVFGGRESEELIDNFRKAISGPDIVRRIVSLARGALPPAYTDLLESIPDYKRLSLKRYTAFSRRVISADSRPEKQEAFFSRLGQALEKVPIGIVGELNGSARGASIDADFLQSCGFLTAMHNDVPGRIVHRIVPEGKSLDLCCRLLEEAYGENSAFSLGYVPDNDGDRGNIVYIDTRRQKAVPIEAQEVFALTVLAELCSQDLFPGGKEAPKGKAVVVNGPTSMRVERIADLFSARVFRAEVGEANVVNLARRVRNGGFSVRILGEGSNGGNITHPATVRDPLNTLFSLAKLLVFRGPETQYDLLGRWRALSGLPAPLPEEFRLQEVISSLPRFVTTSVYEPEAIMKVRSKDHSRLKANYEEIFLREWEQKKDYLRDTFGIHSWREVNYEGIETREGFGPAFRSGSERGGFKIILSDASGLDTDFLWMRGSGTEPVFRILVDCSGSDRRRHDWLLQWHREIIEEADAK